MFSPKSFRIMLVILAVAVFAGFAMAAPAQAKTANPIPPVLCKQNCLRVSDIQLFRNLNIAIDPNNVTAIATVKNSPAPSGIGGVAGVRVTALWMLPDGSQIQDTAITNYKGQAVFNVEEQPGEYTFTILTVEKDKFTFDKWNSILTKTIK